MDSDEIKQRLSARRPGSDDHRQPELAAAWEAAQTDSELLEWSRQEEDFDTAMAAALDESITVPAQLREQLLAIGEQAAAERHTGSASPANTHVTSPANTSAANAARTGATAAAATAAPAQGDNTVSFFSGLRHFFSNRLYGAATAAACIAVIAVGLLFLAAPTTDADAPIDLHSYYSEVTSHYSKLPAITWKTNDTEQIRTELKKRQAPTPNVIPSKLQSLKQLGFDVLHHKGEPITVIPMRDEKKGNVHYLYIISRKALSPLAGTIEQQTSHQKLHGFNLTSWNGPNNHYVLVSPPAESPAP